MSEIYETRLKKAYLFQLLMRNGQTEWDLRDLLAMLKTYAKQQQILAL
jgi:hypothetical protein